MCDVCVYLLCVFLLFYICMRSSLLFVLCCLFIWGVPTHEIQILARLEALLARMNRFLGPQGTRVRYQGGAWVCHVHFAAVENAFVFFMFRQTS